jgi:hypothetical protein
MNMDDELSYIQILSLIVVVGFVLGCLLFIGLAEDTSKCVYKVSGDITADIRAPNATLSHVNGEISGEVYCKDISKMMSISQLAATVNSHDYKRLT